jgi:pilus assembly protein CpaB
MGDRKFGLILMLSLIVAATAAFGVYRGLEMAAADARVPTRPVVVAAVDLTEGQLIGPGDARIVQLPTAAVPTGAYPTLDSIVGRVARIPVFTGEALVPGRLAPVGTGAGLEVKIAPGKRAMAVKIDEVAGLSGLIQPNSRVDVLLTLASDGANRDQRAKLIMGNMRVLSVGSQIERGPDGRPVNATTAALEVTPAEAEQLAVSANQGKIQLALRGYGDPDTVETNGASVRDVVGNARVLTAPTPAPPPARRPAPPPPAAIVTATPAPVRPDSAVVQVYRRDKVTRQMIERRDTIPPDSPLP